MNMGRTHDAYFARRLQPESVLKRRNAVTSLPPRPEVRRRRRRVSKDAPERANGASSWTTLRHAMLRIAAQDEGSSIAKAVHLGSYKTPWGSA
jgi:hypothetical protein